MSLILPVFSLALAQTPKMTTPETLEEAKEIGGRGWRESIKRLPEVIKEIWRERVLPTWRRMYNWFYTNIWSKIVSFFGKEVKPRTEQEIEKRKEILEEEFEKDKEEIKEELPRVGRSLWERFKELIE